MKSKRCWNCDNYEENMEKDPVKKARFDDHNEMDPFKIFPQHCQEIILKHLKKMDVYNMTKVSSYWKLVVESDKSAAAKLKKALTIKADGAEDIIKLLKDDVSYKYAMLSVESIDFACMSKFSSTLENLSFEQSHVSFRDYSCAIQNINFSRLLRLDLIFVDTSMLAWFAECTFPMLKHFQLTFSLRNVDDQEEENELINEIAYGFDGVLQNTLEKLPTLEHFVLISEIGYEFWDSESEPLHASPLLKTLQIPEFNEESITSLPLLEELTICNSLTANEFLRLGIYILIHFSLFNTTIIFLSSQKS